MITIKGDLILTEDLVTFNESIKVEGNIISKDYRRTLKVVGDIDAYNIDAGDIDARHIDAWNIDAWDINAWNINAWNINARNIDAGNIDALDINAWNIICESRTKKSKTSKTICRVYVKNKSKFVKKERDKSPVESKEVSK